VASAGAVHVEPSKNDHAMSVDWSAAFAGSCETQSRSRPPPAARICGEAPGKTFVTSVVSATDNGTNYLAIENEILAAIQSQVRANNYGLEIEFLGIKRLQLPETVTTSVLERMTSERQVLISKSQFEGEAEAQKIKSEADRRAAEILANADGQATHIRGMGEAEAAKSLAVFQQKPELANFIFSLNALEGSLKERSTLIFDRHTSPFDLFGGASTNLLKK